MSKNIEVVVAEAGQLVDGTPYAKGGAKHVPTVANVAMVDGVLVGTYSGVLREGGNGQGQYKAIATLVDVPVRVPLSEADVASALMVKALSGVTASKAATIGKSGITVDYKESLAGQGSDPVYAGVAAALRASGLKQFKSGSKVNATNVKALADAGNQTILAAIERLRSQTLEVSGL